MRLSDHLFYATSAAGPVHTFAADEMRHATKALRLKIGDGLIWTDGRGGRFAGRLIDLQRDAMTASVEEETIDARPPDLTLGVGVLHDATRLEWLVEKATELGAQRVVLLDTARTERSRYRMPRLEAKALAAMKQSNRSFLPLITHIPLAQLLDEYERDPAARKLIAHCYNDLPRKPVTSINTEGREGTVLLIGPEGDFTADEVALAEKAGFSAISLGDARLRTETAAIAALSLLSLH